MFQRQRVELNCGKTAIRDNQKKREKEMIKLKICESSKQTKKNRKLKQK